MRVLVYIPTGLSTPELEILVSKAQETIDAGHTTTVVTCRGGKGYACSLNTYGIRATCGVCKAMVNKGLAALSGTYERLETPPIQTPPYDAARAALFKDRWAIKAYKVDGVDVGQAAYSSYTGQSRDQDLEGGLARRTLHRLLATSEQLVPWFRTVLRTQATDKVIMYNGRQNQYRPLLRVAQQINMPVDVMEYSGQDENCVYMFRNQLPQDIGALNESINNCWENFQGDVAAATQYYYSFRRAGGVVGNTERSYVIGQTQGLLPDGWDKTKHNVVVFNSSEDEFAALGGAYDKTLYLNQTEAMQQLCASLRDDPDVVLWLRIHPNLTHVHWSFAQKLLLLEERFSNVRVIPGGSPVSTYDLLDACDTAVSFGSSMGAEAVYWGKPSILLGYSVYQEFGSIYKPHTHEEAVTLIRTRNLAQLPMEGVLKTALFWRCGGHSIPYFTGTRRTLFRFNGQLLVKTRAQKMIYTVAKFIEKILLERLLNCYLGTTRRVVSEYRQHAHPDR